MNAHLDIHANPMPYTSAPSAEDQSHAHLTEDQIDDQLIGDLAAGPAAHLAACSVCFERVATAADPMDSFSTTTLAWSERRSATLPIPTLSHQHPLWQQRVAWVTACFTVVLGISLANTSHQLATQTAKTQRTEIQRTEIQRTEIQRTEIQRTETQPQQATTQQPATATPTLIQTASVTIPPRPQQIAADNRMLKAIDNEMDTNTDDDSVAALGLTPVSSHPNRSNTPTSLQD